MPAACLMKQAYAIRNSDCNYFLTIYFYKRREPFETIFDGFYRIKCGKKKVNYKKFQRGCYKIACPENNVQKL